MPFRVVVDGRQVARRQLRMAGTGIEQRRRGAHEVEARQQFVELDRARLAVDLVQRESHRDAHEERLRQFDATAFGRMAVGAVRSGNSGHTTSAVEIAELQVAG